MAGILSARGSRSSNPSAWSTAYSKYKPQARRNEHIVKPTPRCCSPKLPRKRQADLWAFASSPMPRKPRLRTFPPSHKPRLGQRRPWLGQRRPWNSTTIIFSTASSQARAIAWPTQLAVPSATPLARRTTRCSSTARAAWARRTCSRLPAIVFCTTSPTRGCNS